MVYDLANATELSEWANRQEAAFLLPEFVRRLVASSLQPSELSKIEFSTREGVNTGGWDGETISTATHTHVPIGHTCWEMGRNKGKKAKADDDYGKRSLELSASEMSNTSFTFVTPRRWTSKDKWVAEKTAEKKWKGVTVLDAENLIAWAEQNIAVHFWITEVIRGRAEDVQSVELFWKTWSSATCPSLPADVVLAGRSAEAERLASKLGSAPSSLVVHSRSKDESIAFIVAVMMVLPGNSRDKVLNNSVITRSNSAFQQVIQSNKPLTIIADFDNPSTTLGVEKGHTVLVPVSNARQVADGGVVTLGKQSTDNLLEPLKPLFGDDINKAYKIAKLGKRNLAALRRSLALHPELLEPGWMRSGESSELMPALLVGCWDENNEQDKKVLEKLAGKPYAEYMADIVKWTSSEDPPIVKEASVWKVAYIDDATSVIMRFATSDQIKSFQQEAAQVLGAQDPIFDLPPDERWLANVNGVSHPYSKEIRGGVINTLAALASGHTDDKPGTSAYTSQQIADLVLGPLMEYAKSDRTGKGWYSLSSNLSLAIEAAPDKTLDAIEADLRTDDPILKSFFVNDSNHYTHSPHIDLLFALDRISWSSRYVSRVALCLARLAELDPGGKTSNRPRKSLIDILSLVHPQTDANAEARLKVLDLILRKFPVIGYDLLLDLVPSSQFVIFEKSTPEYRSWRSKDQKVTHAELYEMISEIVRRLVEYAPKDGTSRWDEVLNEITNLPTTEFDSVVKALITLGPTQLPDDDRNRICAKLRDTISRHREFPDAKWSYPKDRIDQLEDLYNQFAPQDYALKDSWVFDYHVPLLQPKGSDWRENEKLSEELRQTVTENVYKAHGLEGVKRLSQKSNQPFLLGVSLPKLNDKDTAKLMNLISSEDKAEVSLLQGFVNQQSRARGLSWVAKTLKDNDANWSDAQKADFLLMVPASHEIWNEVEKTTEHVQARYWERVSPYGLGADFKYYEYAARQYVKHKRPYEALAAINYAFDDAPIESSLIEEILTQALSSNPKESSVDIQMLGHYAGRAINKLAHDPSVDPETLVRLEISWFPVLRHDRDDVNLQLFKKLANDPSFFVELITAMYKAHSAQKVVPSKEDQQRARFASDIVDAFNITPGSKDDGSIDYDALKSWVDEAIKQLKEADRGSSGEYHIGKLLYYSVAKTNGNWPSDEICRLLDEVQSERLVSGYIDASFNTVSFVSREEDDSLQLAESLESRASDIDFDYPNTARILRRVASSLRSKADWLFHDD